MLQQEAMRLQRRLEDKHPAVEAIGPAGIRGRGELAPVEQVIDIGEHLGKQNTGYLHQHSSDSRGHNEKSGRGQATCRGWKPVPSFLGDSFLLGLDSHMPQDDVLVKNDGIYDEGPIR